jgi:hypothetical protein
LITFLASITASKGYYDFWNGQNKLLEEKSCPEAIFWNSIRPTERDLCFVKSLRFADDDFAYEMYT